MSHPQRDSGFTLIELLVVMSLMGLLMTIAVGSWASWAKANTQSFAVMLKPAMEKMLESRRGEVSPAAATVSGAITGSQLGAILAFLASKVLGQYDPFGGFPAVGLPARTDPPRPVRRCPLVAPPHAGPD